MMQNMMRDKVSRVWNGIIVNKGLETLQNYDLRF